MQTQTFGGESLLLNGFVPESELGFNIRPSWYKTPEPDTDLTREWRRKLRESNFALVKHADFNNPHMVITSVMYLQRIDDNLLMGVFAHESLKDFKVRIVPTEHIKDVVPLPMKEFLARSPRKQEQSQARVWREPEGDYFQRVIAPQIIAAGIGTEWKRRGGR